MADPKNRNQNDTQAPTATAPQGERRRLSKIVHDHKGNATVKWYDAPADYERQVFEIEGGRQPVTAQGGRLNTGSLAIKNDDTHNPYTRIPESERQRAPGQRTDLRKLSAWIKMMRSLEEAKKNNREED
jgi:hypothetical protein